MIWSHTWRTRASVMSLSRVALTTPAIPHMLAFLPFHADNDWKRIGFFRRGRQIPEQFEAIVAVLTGIPVFTVASREDDVGHFPGRHKMQCLFPLVGSAHQLLEKLSKWIANHRILLGGIHAVTVQLDEQPIRTPGNMDSRLLPQREPAEGHRIRRSDSPAFEYRA